MQKSKDMVASPVIKYTSGKLGSVAGALRMDSGDAFDDPFCEMEICVEFSPLLVLADAANSSGAFLRRPSRWISSTV